MEAVEYIVNETNKDAEQKTYFVVRVFWKDPFGILNERQGAFRDFEEALGFEKYLSSTYEKLGLPYLTTFRGSYVNSIFDNTHSHKIQEVLSCKCLF